MLSFRRTFSLPVLAASACLLVQPAAHAQETAASTVQNATTPLPFQSQLDPQMTTVLQVYQNVAGTPIYELSPQDARQQFAAEDAAKGVARNEGKQLAPEPVGRIVDRNIPGPGGALPIRIYTPKGTGPFPVIVYYHGGGFVIATIDTYDASARALTNLTNAIVVSVEYRKAPENPFPAAVLDALASYQWVLKHAQNFGGNPAKVAVAGESAGGNLAAEVCLIARDGGFQMPVHQLLVYPVTQGSVNTSSDLKYANAIPLNRPALIWFFKYYLPYPDLANNPLVSPLNADLHGLPGATIIGAEIDPLQDDGRLYANKLKASGVQVDYTLYPGVTHEFFGMGAVVDKARAAEMQAATDLKAAFGK